MASFVIYQNCMGQPNGGFKKLVFILVVLNVDVSGVMPDSYSPVYVEASWYAWWEKEVSKYWN